ncbi:MAG: glycosyltransferase family 2 protein [Myxococcales bacterium]
MDKAPRVSVVIPTFNSARYLGLTLDSILGQTNGDLEVVLYDDGSSDNTLEISDAYAMRDPRVRVVRGAHVGIAQARNNGFAATNPRSEFVTFFDHDDVWEKDAVELLVSALEAHPECPAAHGVCRCIDSDGELIPGDDHADNVRHRSAVVGERVAPIPQSAPTSFGAVLVKNYITTPGTSLVRRTAFQRVGGFEASTVPCDDWDMNLRIARLGDFAFVDKILLNWRRHAGATSNLSKRWRTAYMLTRKRSVLARENSAEQRQIALCALRDEVVGLQREAVGQVRSGSLKTAAKKLARSLLLGSIYVSGLAPQRA